jgi:hypothetical protein
MVESITKFSLPLFIGLPLNRDYAATLATEAKRWFWDLPPRVQFRKGLFFQPNHLVGARMTQVSLKNIFFANYTHTTPVVSRFFMEDRPKDFKTALPHNGGTVERQKKHGHTPPGIKANPGVG